MGFDLIHLQCSNLQCSISICIYMLSAFKLQVHVIEEQRKFTINKAL